MKKRFSKFIFLFLVIMLLSAAVYANAEAVTYETLLNGDANEPFSVIISSPGFQKLPQFDTERTEDLNRLLQHFSCQLTVSGEITGTKIYVDRDPVVSVISRTENGKTMTVYAAEGIKNAVTEEQPEENNSLFLFLDSHFFPLNQMLDELYPAFEKTESVFSDKAKSASTSLNFSGFGKGVRRVTIVLPADYVQEQYSQTLLSLNDSSFYQQFVSKLLFSGMQKIGLLFDQSDRLLRINYDGTAGYTENSMRKISLVWKCLRSADRKKDQLTLKTPTIQGSDRDNISYERDLNRTDPEKPSLVWDYQLDEKHGKDKRKIQYNADMLFAEGKLNGKVTWNERKDDQNTKTVMTADLLQENGSEYNGTLEITNYSGKIVKTGMISSVRLLPSTKEEVSALNNAFSSDALHQGETDADSLHTELNKLLVRKMIGLPSEDTVILYKDIPEDTWASLISISD